MIVVIYWSFVRCKHHCKEIMQINDKTKIYIDIALVTT